MRRRLLRRAGRLRPGLRRRGLLRESEVLCVLPLALQPASLHPTGELLLLRVVLVSTRTCAWTWLPTACTLELCDLAAQRSVAIEVACRVTLCQ